MAEAISKEPGMLFIQQTRNFVGEVRASVMEEILWRQK